MRYLLAALICFVAPVLALADEAAAQTSSPAQASSTGAASVDKTPVDKTTDRGLAYLVKDALAWKEEHKCVSCHQRVVGHLGDARSQAARPLGRRAGAGRVDQMGRRKSGDGKTGVPRPEGIPKALNEKAVQFAIALGANQTPDASEQAGLKLLLATVKGDQIENGSWASWPDTRPPIFGNSDERTTATATLALLPAAAAGDETAIAARDKGVRWLEETKTDDDPQSIALRLVLWVRLGRPAEEWQPLVQRIKERQNTDGGWSQTTDMPSDAWATGQALYALAHAGIKSDDPMVERASAFLAETQRDDGSWPMTSRPTKPGGAGSTSLIPITDGGSAWAVLGLVRSH